VESLGAEDTVKRENREENVGWVPGNGWFFFFVDFGPHFLHAQAMKSTSIYRRWKRVILSTQGKNCSH
jgi:hypothetical protein